MTTVKQPRTPRQPEAIHKAALLLPLADRVKLRNALSASIDNEVKALKQAAEEAASVANGK